ncbi:MULTISPECIES: CDP-diacylglycerol--glycerol-3-phosphate 3-phosphatidyltransferase [Thermomonosporaceae]|uniref:CDP-diacylglycerol--glycerol-3-phosphate 3-phosphatidyltransferase n=1 Tax=Thermomonosporaceae TaxID=2012 RepID=UPI00255A9599|nr:MULTISPECIES: CDP-diacylglycerol--glycerol-3-phosphate 3-phosphatidyltransferase [Thermomonosporaceae]MDL4771461.1 CDP-diacylglycerol--glycerol-3-phosphate 3-phosphatidyltransferase [Actinomadura xylanilytica]
MTAGTPDSAAGPPDPSPHPAPPSVYNIANALTLIRIALVPVFVWLLFLDGTAMRLAAFVVFAIASITDKIDGDLARSRGLVTDFGKIADPIADKALTGGALISLSVLGELWWWVTAVILVREVGITLLRLVVIRHGVIPASKGGKLKTALQVFAIGFFILPGPLDPVRWALMAAALVVTIVTGVDYLVQAWRLRGARRDRPAA